MSQIKLNFIKRKRLKDFFSAEKKELKKWRRKRYSWLVLVSRSAGIFSDYFIPSIKNNHHPKALRSKPLLGYLTAVILIKLALVAVLFFYYPSSAQMSEIVSENILGLVNQSRQESGLAPLSLNLSLNKFAAAKAREMIERNYFAHDNPEGKKPWEFIERSEYNYASAGENLAMDFLSAEDVHQALMLSPSHKRNILDPKYKDIGIAVLNGNINGRQTILLVQFFAVKRSDVSIVSVKPDDNIKADPVLSSMAESGTVLSAESPFEPISLALTFGNALLLAFAIFLAVLIVINFFIRIKIQQPAVILQSLAVLALIVALIFVKLHFLETAHLEPLII